MFDRIAGWFQGIFHKAPSDKVGYAPVMDGLMPVYSQFGTNIYASDVVQQALSCIVNEMKKLRPTHIRTNGTDPVPAVRKDIQNALNKPNALMTTSDLIEKTMWLLLMNYNAFIVPTFSTWRDKTTGEERRYYDGLYPIQPSEVDFIQDISGNLFTHFRFPNGYETTIAYKNLIHLKYKYSVSQYMGGNEFGQPDNRALLDTLELNHTMLKGIAQAMKASYAVNGVVKFNTLIDNGKTETALKELESKLKANESGFLPLDLKADFTPLPRNVKVVDEATLKFVDSKILRNWGVPLPILTGDFTKEQYEAFYSKTLEPLIISISQEFTKKLFTDRELSYGNEVKFYPKDLIFMTVAQTLEMIQALSPTGGLLENEKRVALGLRPLPQLEGKRYMSLNWIDADSANQYQIGADSSNK